MFHIHSDLTNFVSRSLCRHRRGVKGGLAAALLAFGMISGGGDDGARAQTLKDNAARAADQRERVQSIERLQRLESFGAGARAARERRALKRIERRQSGPETPTYSQRLTRERLRRTAPGAARIPGTPRAGRHPFD